jgi:predicted amidohydrolase YtcJ
VKRLALLLTLTALLTAIPPASTQTLGKADLLLLNANVVTMNPRQPSAEAVAIVDGRIAWIGSTAEAKTLFHNAADTMDLGGATVLPGIIDAHAHLMNLGESFLKLDLKGIATQKRQPRRVKEKAATLRSGEWILGWGWDEGKWAAQYPTHDLLTNAAPTNPVFLTGLHGFASWANKRALLVAGINKDTRDPENGKILRDEKTGEPSGVLVNRAQDLITSHVAPLTLDSVKMALELAARECLRNGLTSVHEARVTPIMLQALREMVRDGRLPLRVYAMLDGANPTLIDEWLKRGPEIDPQHRLTIRSVKVFADGALGSRGAALFAPYSDAPGTKGMITTNEARLTDLTRRCLGRGFQVATHAIGDAANHQVLNAYERALREVSGMTSATLAGVKGNDARLRVEHAQMLGCSRHTSVCRARSDCVYAADSLHFGHGLGGETNWPSARKGCVCVAVGVEDRRTPADQLGFSGRDFESVLWNLCGDDPSRPSRQTRGWLVSGPAHDAGGSPARLHNRRLTRV